MYRVRTEKETGRGMWDEERDRKLEKEGVIWKQGASKEEIKGVRKLTGKDCY